MPGLPEPQRMSLDDAISYVAERCNCPREKASKAVHAALGEDKLQAIASKLTRNPHYPEMGDFGKYVDNGLFPVPPKVWAGYSWSIFDDRYYTYVSPEFQEQRTNGGGVGPVYRRPVIATADINAWLGSEGNQTHRVVRAYRDLDLHPLIGEAASKLYLDGHYANAIEDAVKALNNVVRLRSGKQLDGADLMKTVFSPKHPILRFSDLEDRSDQDEQEGFMMMFAGAVTGLRNPRAHKLIKDDPERALEFIAFVSLLAKLLDEATS
jgi:uncharacterized protein (TIGR02391 family)